VLIELFSLGVTAESLRAKRDRKSSISLQRGQFDAKFQVVRVLADGQTHTHTQTDRYTDWQTQTDFIICPMLYAIAMGQIENITKPPTVHIVADHSLHGSAELL